MPLIDSSQLDPALRGHDAHQIYNGLDCCVTFEVFQELSKLMDPQAQLIYDFERGMQAPALDMMRRGVLIDEYERREGIRKLESERDKIVGIWDQYCNAILDRPLNVGSPHQLKQLFYDVMKLPIQYKRDKKTGERRPSTDRQSLEKLSAYLFARPLIECIFAFRDRKKKLEILTTDVDSDGRMRTSYNVSATETGRWSSSYNYLGEGTNLQNITPELRKMFISDLGMKMGGIDLEQAESRVVGLLLLWLFGDSTYLDACEREDLHTFVTRMIWTDLPWTGDPHADKEIAERQFYRHFTYRDMSKRSGHASNYRVTPPTMSSTLKIPLPLCREFQHKYFGAFPLERWHRWTAERLQLDQYIDSPLGDRRYFFGRPEDDGTLREAIAHVPQSVVGRLLNVALWRMWKLEPRIQLLLQVHDAIYFQFEDNPTLEQELMPKLLKMVEIPLTLGGRTMIIPGEGKTGWNWANEIDKRIPNWINPNGLRKFKLGVPDGRKRLIGLDRPIS